MPQLGLEGNEERDINAKIEYDLSLYEALGYEYNDSQELQMQTLKFVEPYKESSGLGGSGKGQLIYHLWRPTPWTRADRPNVINSLGKCGTTWRLSKFP